MFSVLPMCGSFVVVGVTTATINSLIEETHVIRNLVEGTKKMGYKVKVGLVEAPYWVNPVMIMGMAGAADDKPAKVMVGLGMVGLITSLVVTPVVWVKVAVGASIGCFAYGFVRGVRRSLRVSAQ